MLDELKTWLKVSLDIRGFSYPASIVATNYGDLILDQAFQGKVYLRGLLLPSSTLDSNPFKLGYNFIKGRVNRDRQRLADDLEEADLVTRIWESAIEKEETVLLPIYVNLLRKFPRVPDVALADHLLKDCTRSLIWKSLLKEADGRGFYYSEKLGPQVGLTWNRLFETKLICTTQSIEIIKRSLQKEPACLPDTLWSMLEARKLIGSPREEQAHRFRNAEVCEPPLTLFARNIQRGLESCFALVGPREIKILFVRSGTSDVAMLFDMENENPVLKIHSRWLDYGATHEYPCKMVSPSNAASSVTFCDHIVEELVREAFGRILNGSYRQVNVLMRVMRANIQLMPRNISLEPGHEPGCLLGRWSDGETEYF